MNEKISGVEKQILDELLESEPGTEKYDLLIRQLLDMQFYKNTGYKGLNINNDVVIQSLTSILGIVLLASHERLHIITAKAFSWIPRP